MTITNVICVIKGAAVTVWLNYMAGGVCKNCKEFYDKLHYHRHWGEFDYGQAMEDEL